MEWISLEEMYPTPKDKKIIAYFSATGNIATILVEDHFELTPIGPEGCFTGTLLPFSKDITHWMHLPCPPEPDPSIQRIRYYEVIKFYWYCPKCGSCIEKRGKPISGTENKCFVCNHKVELEQG